MKRCQWIVLSMAALGAFIGSSWGETRFQEGFEQGLAAWKPIGNAAFSLEMSGAQEGTACARITVADGEPPAYQQLEYVFEPVAHGDEFLVSVWVKSGALGEGSGAYAALEFLDNGGKRLSIVHSEATRDPKGVSWRELVMEGRAPKQVARAAVHLVVNAHGTAWFDHVTVEQTARQESLPDLGNVERQVSVDTGKVILPRFGGVGFHMFYHSFPASSEVMDTVIAKRWRELNPSWARLNHHWSWDSAAIDRVTTHLLRLKNDTQTEVYLTTWDPKDVPAGAERAGYAREVADLLAYWIEQKGASNVTTYCLTNELSMGEWGALFHDLPKFKDYHAELFNAFKERGLPVRLLATDASPVSYWSSIRWGAENMDNITGVYGGHHYINEFDLDDVNFYRWFLSKLQDVVQTARSKGKDFILGEFGAKQDGRTVDGIKRDTCVYWDTPDEPYVALQLADAVIAAIQSGAYAMGYWTFMDLPDEYNANYINKWGLFKRSGADFSTRAHYYAYGLLTRYFRGPASTVSVETNDRYLRAAAVQPQGQNTLSLVVLNRYPGEVPVRITLNGVADGVRFRKYVYDPAHVPQNPFGDLQGPSETVEVKDGVFMGRLGAQTITVYTSMFDDVAPETVRDFHRTDLAEGVRLAWQASADPDFCYYRVYRAPDTETPLSVSNQIVSTVGLQYVDASASSGVPMQYAVVAVDRSGNAGLPTWK